MLEHKEEEAWGVTCWRNKHGEEVNMKEEVGKQFSMFTIENAHKKRNWSDEEQEGNTTK